MCHLSTILLVSLTWNTCLAFPEGLLMPSCHGAIMGWAERRIDAKTGVLVADVVL